MKIGFINNAYFPTRFGGSEVSVQLLAEAVVRQGHAASVLTMSPTAGKREQGRVNGVEVSYVPHRNLYSPPDIPRNPLTRIAWHLVDSYNPWMAAEVDRWVEAESPDVVHTNTLGGLSVSAWDAVHRHGVPLVHTLREYYLQCRLMALNRKGKECTSICAFCRVCAVPRRGRSFRPHAVVGISRFILDSHLNAGFFPGVGIQEVIFNPVRTENQEPKPKASSSRLRLGFIGRIERLKGIDFLLQQVQTLPPDSYELYIGGTGDTPYTASVRNKALGIPVHWLGYVEPPVLFEKIDVLVVPSIWKEPFGRVIVEAYFHGIPVLASRRGGITEIVEENVTGLLFDPDLPGDFQQKLRKLTPETCRAMGTACLERSRGFDPDLIGRKYLELFARVQSASSTTANLSKR